MSFRSRCTSLSRYLIILINVVIAIVALALIALALWIRFDVNFEHNLRINIQNVNVTPPAMNRIKEQIQTAILCAFYVIIGVSGASLACSMIGIVAAVIQNRKLYVFSMIFLVILVLLEIAIGIFVIVYQSNLRNGINVYTSLSFQYNTNDAASLMDRYSCCGDGTAKCL
ncbi:Protein CBR-TSP-3 [Aphelenchoides bicaudatus]|nr:Protein CBR-TSP-3 [Aphelenchoides bicaudatus]